jgi:hypothetical protein
MHTDHGFVVLLIPMHRPKWTGKNASSAADTPLVLDAHAHLGLGDRTHGAGSGTGRIRASPTDDHDKTSFHTAYGAHGDRGTGETPFPEAPGTSEGAKEAIHASL